MNNISKDIEDRKISYLRTLVDLVIAIIKEDNMSYEEALNIVESVKSVAVNLFPGKESTFELIYRPRFKRILMERYELC